MYKKKNYQSLGSTIICLIVACFILSCSDDKEEIHETFDSGMIRFGFANSDDFSEVCGRAITTEALEMYKDINNYKVVITKDERPVHEYASVKDVPNSIELQNGSYKVTAYYGKEHVKSRDEFYSVASKFFTVQGNDQSISLLCEPTCAKVSVNFAPEMSTYFDDYKVDYSTSALGTDVATWAKTDIDPWYLLVQPQGERINAKITLTPKAQYNIPTGTIVKSATLRPNQGWKLNIAPSYNATNGNLGITVTIDQTTNDIPVDIEVPAEWITQE